MLRWPKRVTGILVALSIWGCGTLAPGWVSQIEEVQPDVPGSLPGLERRVVSDLVAQTETPTKKKKQRNGEFEPIKRTYEELLKKPDTLGFTSTEALYRNIYFHMRNSFVEEVPDSHLRKGILAELETFLTQAKVDKAPLKELEAVRPVELYAQAQELLKGKVDSNLLGYAIMNGLLDGLRDNYSVIMTPTEWGRMDEQLNAKEFGGIGIYIELDRDRGNQLTVFEPIEGTPAWKAGLLSGDYVLKIDGKTTQGVTLDIAQTMIRGPEGSQVVLTIERDGKVQDYTVTRGKIHTVSVSSRMFPGQIGYVRLRAFGSGTGDELQLAVSKLKSDGAKSLILDLRNNGGGYIDASVDVVGEFTDRNTLVVYTVDRSGRKREYRSTKSGKISIPTVVLINEFSASAAEITAGAMLDHKLATVVGDKSFGKGSVQQLYNLDVLAGRERSPRLKLTVARFYTPSGRVIDRKGIEPQVVVDMEPRYVGKVEKDIQLKKAVEMLGGKLK